MALASRGHSKAQATSWEPSYSIKELRKLQHLTKATSSSQALSLEPQRPLRTSLLRLLVGGCNLECFWGPNRYCEWSQSGDSATQKSRAGARGGGGGRTRDHQVFQEKVGMWNFRGNLAGFKIRNQLKHLKNPEGQIKHSFDPKSAWKDPVCDHWFKACW